jgi:hypothetical protein
VCSTYIPHPFPPIHTTRCATEEYDSYGDSLSQISAKQRTTSPVFRRVLLQIILAVAAQFVCTINHLSCLRIKLGLEKVFGLSKLYIQLVPGDFSRWFRLLDGEVADLEYVKIYRNIYYVFFLRRANLSLSLPFFSFPKRPDRLWGPPILLFSG